MNFDLSEEQRAFQTVIGEILSDAYPVARAILPFDGGDLDFSGWQKLMEMGVGGIVVDEAHGGMGLELLDLALIAEEVGRYAMPGPFLDHSLATYAIVLGGDEAQKAHWLPLLAIGEKRATIAFAEGDNAWLSDRWTLEADDKLTGTKRFVPHAEGADLFVAGLAGGRLGLVERADEITPLPSVDGGRRLADVRFENAPMQILRGEADAGARVCDAALVLLAADAFGGASRCVEMSVSYAKEREQFGQPIGQFQAMKHQLADMAVAVEPMVGLYWFAAHAFDHERHEASLNAALAKAHITETYANVSRRAVEAHGGIGYTWEHGVHVWLKRAVFDQSFFGMPQYHRARAAEIAGW